MIQAEDDSDLYQSVGGGDDELGWVLDVLWEYSLQGLLAVGGEEKSAMAGIFILSIGRIEMLLKIMERDFGEKSKNFFLYVLSVP